MWEGEGGGVVSVCASRIDFLSELASAQAVVDVEEEMEEEAEVQAEIGVEVEVAVEVKVEVELGVKAEVEVEARVQVQVEEVKHRAGRGRAAFWIPIKKENYM